MGLLGLFQQPTPQAQITSDDNWAVVNSPTTITTIAPVKGFQKVSDRQLEREKRELEEMRKFLANFRKFLDIRAQRAKLDVEATKELNGYFTILAQTLVEKNGAVTAKEIALQKLRIPLANQSMQLEATTVDVTAQIERLRQQQDAIAAKRLKPANGKKS